MELMNLDNLREVLEEYAEAVRQEYIANLERDGRPASGELINTMTARVDYGDNAFEVVLNLKEYWKYIEYGTKGWYTGNPGRKFPPVNKILDWIQIKPVIPRPDSRGRIPTPQQLAYLIGRKIQQFGTKGRADLTEAKMNVTERYRQRIAEALGHDMKDYIRKIVAK